MKWRKVKKKFKKEKPTMIGRIMCATHKNGSQFWMKITDIRIYPSGGNKVRYDYTAKPYEPPQTPQYSSNGNGFSLTFDVSVETKQIKKLLKQF